MAYFDGIKVGDTVYLWEKPMVVDKTSNLGCQEDPSVRARALPNVTGFWFSMDGEAKLGFGQCFFWQPVKPPVAPPRPKRWVEKVAPQHGARSCKMDAVCVVREFHIPGYARNIKCTYEEQE